MSYKEMTLDQLEIERLNVREQLVFATGVHRKDLNKYLSKLNDRVGILRKQK